MTFNVRVGVGPVGQLGVRDRSRLYPALAAPQISQVGREGLEERVRVVVQAAVPANGESAVADVGPGVEHQRSLFGSFVEYAKRHVMPAVSDGGWG
jgi:hypothetical protein